jgi:hypothetical protein
MEKNYIGKENMNWGSRCRNLKAWVREEGRKLA